MTAETTTTELDMKLIHIIGQAARLGWVRKMDGEYYVQMADLEKIVYGLMDEGYGKRIDQWVKESGLEDETRLKLPVLKPRDYDVLKENVEFQAELLRRMMKGEQCIFKPGCCPFKEKAEGVVTND
jgi:hypothetical protein